MRLNVMRKLIVVAGCLTGTAHAQLDWVDLQNGDVLEAADLNTRFNDLREFARTLPTCPFGEAPAPGADGWTCEPQPLPENCAVGSVIVAQAEGGWTCEPRLPACMEGEVLVADGQGGWRCRDLVRELATIELPDGCPEGASLVARGDAIGCDQQEIVEDTSIGVILGLGAEGPGACPNGQHAACFSNVSNALGWLGPKRIIAPATVSIRVAAGTYVHESPIEVGHPNGRQIEIVGNVDEPQQAVLVFADGADGLVISGGAHLGLLAGLTLRGGHADDSRSVGLLVDRGSTVSVGALHFVAENDQPFGFGDSCISAARGSVVTQSTGLGEVICRSSRTAGFAARNGAVVELPGAVAEQVRGTGFVATTQSLLIAEGAMASSNGNFGFSASAQSMLNASGASANDNLLSGFRADGKSYLIAVESTSEDNASSGRPHAGYAATGMSFVDARSSASVGDTTAFDIKRFSYMDVQSVTFMNIIGTVFDERTGDGDPSDFEGNPVSCDVDNHCPDSACADMACQ